MQIARVAFICKGLGGLKTSSAAKKKFILNSRIGNGISG
jgi:hypothetical protein